MKLMRTEQELVVRCEIAYVLDYDVPQLYTRYYALPYSDYSKVSVFDDEEMNAFWADAIASIKAEVEKEYGMELVKATVTYNIDGEYITSQLF